MAKVMALELVPYNLELMLFLQELLKLQLIDPLKSAEKPKEITNLVLFLASNVSSHIIGANLGVNGG